MVFNKEVFLVQSCLQCTSTRVLMTYLGNFCINHIFFADDICLKSPSLAGLQYLINVCSAYAKDHDIVFNCNKSYVVRSPEAF